MVCDHANRVQLIAEIVIEPTYNIRFDAALFEKVDNVVAYETTAASDDDLLVWKCVRHARILEYSARNVSGAACLDLGLTSSSSRTGHRRAPYEYWRAEIRTHRAPLQHQPQSSSRGHAESRYGGRWG